LLKYIYTKNSRNVLTAKSKSILTDFDNFALNLKKTKLNSQTKMTKSISQKMTISNLECVFEKKSFTGKKISTSPKVDGLKNGIFKQISSCALFLPLDDNFEK